ncbi:MAG: TIGR00269 family protein [Candidatus Geothermarchaeales archaeon]
MTGDVSMNSCDRCAAPAVYRRRYSGETLCRLHFCASVERKVEKEVRRFLKRDSVVGLAVSGGKDSAVMTHVMVGIGRKFPLMRLVGLVVDEGIEGYRNKSVEVAERLLIRLGIPYEVFRYDGEFGTRVEEIVSLSGHTTQSCTYCGVLRRRAVDILAERLGVEMVLTGHNADDIAQTILMNLFQGNVKHLTSQLVLPDSMKREKPLRGLLEKEVVMYAILNDIEYHGNPCPYTRFALRNDVRNFLTSMEEKHSGITYSILRTAEKIEKTEVRLTDRCHRCGRPSSRELCKACEILEYGRGLVLRTRAGESEESDAASQIP